VQAAPIPVSEPDLIDPYRNYVCDSCGGPITDLQDIVYNATTGEFFHSDAAHRDMDIS